MRKLFISIGIVLFLCTSFPLHAQKKDFTYAQLFQNGATDVSKSLPNISGWADDDHYLENRVDPADGQTKLMSVEVKTGKAVAFAGKNESENKTVAIPGISQEARNIT